MKDTIITSKRKQLELKTLLACFIIMNLIIREDRSEQLLHR